MMTKTPYRASLNDAQIMGLLARYNINWSLIGSARAFRVGEKMTIKLRPKNPLDPVLSFVLTFLGFAGKEPDGRAG